MQQSRFTRPIVAFVLLFGLDMTACRQGSARSEVDNVQKFENAINNNDVLMSMYMQIEGSVSKKQFEKKYRERFLYWGTKSADTMYDGVVALGSETQRLIRSGVGNDSLQTLQTDLRKVAPYNDKAFDVLSEDEFREKKPSTEMLVVATILQDNLAEYNTYFYPRDRTGELAGRLAKESAGSDVHPTESLLTAASANALAYSLECAKLHELLEQGIGQDTAPEHGPLLDGFLASSAAQRRSSARLKGEAAKATEKSATVTQPALNAAGAQVDRIDFLPRHNPRLDIPAGLS